VVPIDLSGKKAVVFGVTNDRSLGFAIGKKLKEAGAQLAMTYQGERVRPLVEKAAAGIADLLLELDVTDEARLKAVATELKERFGSLDAVVHAIAFAPRRAMEGSYLETTKEDWLKALEVSAYSLVAIVRELLPLLNPGAGVVALTYYASEKYVPRYNVMAIAKSALEASVRYLAAELGPKNIRVNAISAGPVRTVAARSIPGFTRLWEYAEKVAPLRRNVTQEEVGNAGLFLLSPLASGITGEVLYVDAGYHILGVPDEVG